MAVGFENLNKDWKMYALLVGIVVVIGLMINTQMKLSQMQGRIERVASTLESVEGIATGTDYTLGALQQQVGAMEGKVDLISQRLSRRRK
jgi:hypothetical protein